MPKQQPSQHSTEQTRRRPILVGITGGSGAILAVRLLDVLLAAGRDVHLSISMSGADVLKQELGIVLDLNNFDHRKLLPHLEKSLAETPPAKKIVSLLADKVNAPTINNIPRGTLHYYHCQDYMGPMASGTFRSEGMIVVPCSGSTLSAISLGSSNNLIQRAGEVCMKERHPLVLVTRETPLSLSHITNMRRATLGGATILPASPGWYHGVTSLRDLIDFMVMRICDQINLDTPLIKRWGDT